MLKSLPINLLQKSLKDAGLKKATLHSFRHTFNTKLRDLGLGIADRQVLLGHATSSVTKIYTHPNLTKAQEYVNLL